MKFVSSVTFSATSVKSLFKSGFIQWQALYHMCTNVDD